MICDAEKAFDSVIYCYLFQTFQKSGFICPFRSVLKPTSRSHSRIKKCIDSIKDTRCKICFYVSGILLSQGIKDFFFLDTLKLEHISVIEESNPDLVNITVDKSKINRRSIARIYSSLQESYNVSRLNQIKVGEKKQI